MASLNKVLAIGNLGRDPEMRYTTSGKAVASFSIACSESWKDKEGNKQERTEWLNCSAFDKLAEICGKYLVKGKQVYIEGRLQTDKYEKDGQTRYSTKVVLSDMKMLGSKGDSNGNSNNSEPAAALPASSAPRATQTDPDDAIPF